MKHQITTLHQLHAAVLAKRAIVLLQPRGSVTYEPAAFVWNRNAACVFYWITRGMYIYVRRNEKLDKKGNIIPA
jgi:hypothetical protein